MHWRSTLLFGGDDGSLYGDTWILSDRCWVKAADSGPTPRYQHAMASARGRIVLFGGWDGQRTGDTWEWDGTTWTQVSASGPSARYGHAMAYDSARERTVLFGGWSGSLSRETWEWDGATWGLVANDGPVGRAYHAMVYDSVRRETIVIGGDDGEPRDDVWAWNGASWHRLPDMDALPVMGHAAVFDESAGLTVTNGGRSFNGSGFAQLGETWVMDAEFWELRAGVTTAANLAVDAERGVVVGCSATAEWNGVTWERSGGGVGFAPAATDCVNGRGVIAQVSNGTYHWDGFAWTQIPGANGPTADVGAATACDCSRSCLVLFQTGWTWNSTATRGNTRRRMH